MFLKKLTPRILAILLIVVVIAFVVVITIAINKGAGVSFWGLEIAPKSQIEPTPPPAQPEGMTAEAFIGTLPIELQGEVEESRDKIVTTLSQFKKKATMIDELESQLDVLRKKLTDTESKLSQALREKDSLEKIIAEKEDKFLNRITRLEDEIAKWDGTINTRHKVDEKQDVFLLVQQLLRRIGYYDGPLDADPIRTQNALSKYKRDKNFQEKELWTHVTRQTIIFFVRDYADTLLKESRG